MIPDWALFVAPGGAGKQTFCLREYLRGIGREDTVRDTVVVAPTVSRARAFRQSVAVTLQIASGNNTDIHDRAQIQPLLDVAPSAQPASRLLEELSCAPILSVTELATTMVNNHGLFVELAAPDGPLPLDGRVVIAHEDSGPIARDVIENAGEPTPEVAALLDLFTLDQLVQLSTELAGVPLSKHGARILPIRRIAERLRRAMTSAFREALELDGRLGSHHNTPCRPYARALALWRAAQMPEPAHPDVVRWIHYRATTSTAPDAETLMSCLKRRMIRIGSTEVSAGDLVSLAGSYADDEAVTVAEAVRKDLVALAHRVRQAICQRAVETGRLDEASAIDTATRLAAEHPDVVGETWRQLIVLDLHDLTPSELELVTTLDRALREVTIATGYEGQVTRVGAISRETFRRFVQRASDTGRLSHGERNHRAVPAMVDAVEQLAQLTERALGLERRHERISSDARNWAHQLTPAHKPWIDPVAVVTHEHGVASWSTARTRNAALDVFADRLAAAWIGEGRRHDSAVVMVHEWRDGLIARRRLDNALRQRVPELHLALGGPWPIAAMRVVQDVGLLLRALWRPDDDIAQVGLLKLPFINFTDGALAAISAGDGLRDRKGRPLHRLRSILRAAEMDEDVYLPEDRRAFAFVVPILVAAQKELGRRSTAAVIEHVARHLSWREVLAAGPEPLERLCQLDDVLAWIRRTEDEGGVDVDGVCNALDDHSTAVIPRRCIPHPYQVEVVVLDEQIAGRSWDHVFIDTPGSLPVIADGRRQHFMLASSDEPAHIVGLCFDATGGVNPTPDFAGGVARALWTKDLAALAWSRLYTAMSRAVRTITMGLTRSEPHGLTTTLWECWTRAAPSGVGVHRLRGENALPRPQTPVVIDQRPTDVPSPRSWRRPQRIHLLEERLDQWDERDAHCAQMVESCEIRQGAIIPLCAGPSDLPISLPELLRLWLTRGGLTGRPSQAAASRVVKDVLGRDDDELTAWLTDVSGHIVTHQPQLDELLRRTDTTVRTNVAIYGRLGNQPVTGRAEVLLTRPQGRCVLICLLTGDAPYAREDLVTDDRLDRRFAQLAAQRVVLESSGFFVEQALLLFPQAATVVGWSWSAPDTAIDTQPSVTLDHLETDVLAQRIIGGDSDIGVTAPVDRRLVLYDALVVREREQAVFTLDLLAAEVGYRVSTLTHLVDEFLRDIVVFELEPGRYRAAGVLEMVGDQFVELLEGRFTMRRRVHHSGLRQSLETRAAGAFEVAMRTVNDERPESLHAGIALLGQVVELIGAAEGIGIAAIGRAAAFRQVVDLVERLRRGGRLLVPELRDAIGPVIAEILDEIDIVFSAAFARRLPNFVEHRARLPGTDQPARLDFDLLERRYGEGFVDDAMRLLLDVGATRAPAEGGADQLFLDELLGDLPDKEASSQATLPLATPAPDTTVEQDLDDLSPPPPPAAPVRSPLVDRWVPLFEAQALDIDTAWSKVLCLLSERDTAFLQAMGLITLEDVVRAIDPDGPASRLDEMGSRRARRIRRDLEVVAEQGIERYLTGPRGAPANVGELVTRWLDTLDAETRKVARLALLEGANTDELADETGLDEPEINDLIRYAFEAGQRQFGPSAKGLVAHVIEALDEAGGLLHKRAVLEEVAGAEDLRQVRFACQIAGERDMRIWRGTFLTNLSGAHRRTRLERFRRALTGSGRGSLPPSLVRIHGHNSSLLLDAESLIEVARLAFDMKLDDDGNLIVARASSDLVAEILERSGAAMTIAEILEAYSSVAQQDGTSSPEDTRQLQEAIRAQLQHRRDVYAIERDVFIHRAVFDLPPRRLKQIARFCARRLANRPGRVSVDDLLGDLEDAGFDTRPLTPWLLVDVLAHHPDLLVFRGTFEVVHGSSLDNEDAGLEEAVASVLLSANEPLTTAEIMNLLPRELAVREVSVRACLQRAEWALDRGDQSYLHADHTGLDAESRRRLVDSAIESLPETGEPTATTEILEQLDSDEAAALLSRSKDAARWLWSMLTHDERVRLDSGHLVARVLPRSETDDTTLLQDVVVRALSELMVAKPGDIYSWIADHYGFDGSVMSVSHAFLQCRERGRILRLPGFLYCAREALPEDIAGALTERSLVLPDVGTVRLPDLVAAELWKLACVLMLLGRKGEGVIVARALRKRPGVPREIQEGLAEMMQPEPRRT